MCLKILVNINHLVENVVSRAKKDAEIIGVMLYGSVLQNSNYNDIDIALFLKKTLSSKQMYEKRLNFLANAAEKMDIQIYNLLPLPVQKEVLAGTTLYETEEMYDLAYRTIREYEDFERYRIEYREAYLNEH